MNSDEMNALAMGWDSSERTRQKSYRVERGIAVLPVTGTLVHKLGYINPVSGMSGYNGIAKRLQQAISDPDVRGVLLDIDSPGGEVAGAFDTADLIARRESKTCVGAGQRYGLQRCLFAGVSVFAPADNADRHSWFNRCPDGSPLRRKSAGDCWRRRDADLRRRAQS